MATRRMPNWALDPRIKSLNYLNNILAKLEAQQAGVEEAVLASGGGAIAGISNTTNLAVGDGAILLHGYLEGLFSPGGARPPFLPTRIPEAEARRILGVVAYAGVLRLFTDLGPTAADGMQTTAVLGDPALRLRIYPY